MSAFQTHNWNKQVIGPVIFNVPHAGTDYPQSLLSAARLNFSQLQQLEDTAVDRLAQAAIQDGFATQIATRARAWIDLNRAIDDVDPGLIIDPHTASHIRPTKRSAQGLGLFPSHLPGAGPIWRSKFMWSHLQSRIDEDYTPYYAHLRQALEVRAQRLGGAILLDLHSMPPPRHNGRMLDVDIIFGTLSGQSCDNWLVSAMEHSAAQMGLRTLRDTPYSGANILASFGQPLRNIHALQIEVNRALYIDVHGDIIADAADTLGLKIRTLAQSAVLAWHNLQSDISIAAE
jgi:N-formylglutamate amidohydrolase